VKQKKIIGLALCILLFAFGMAAEGQEAKKVPLIGFLTTNSRSSEWIRVVAFQQGLRKVGYEEGKNIFVDYRYADGKLERLPEFAAELVRMKAAVMVTTGTPPTRAAQQATKAIPIVMTVVGDPVASGFVDSLAKPGGNITGLSQISSDLNGKRLELLKEAFPKISRVGVFVNTVVAAQRMDASWQEIQAAAKPLKIKLVSLEVRAPNPDLDGAFRSAATERVDALIIGSGPVLNLHRKRFVDLTAKNRFPAIYPTSEYVDVGGLMSYGVDYDDLYRRAPYYVDKILKGAKPADLPVEQPTKFELVINLKAAKQTGLTIPPNVLARADRVIK